MARKLTEDDLEKLINELISQGRAEEFYWRYDWKKLSADIIRRNHNECMQCKARHKVSKATQVHHRYPMRRYPRWALSEFVTLPDGNRERNLYPLCANCHEEIELENKASRGDIKPKFFNEERW